ncbi:MAG: hypothetical protein ACR2GK_06190, partial [Gemmatimonadaceae bacterium]
MRELLLAPELNHRGDHESRGKREEQGKYRQTRARQPADYELRRNLGSQGYAKVKLGKSLVEAVDNRETLVEGARVRRIDLPAAGSPGFHGDDRIPVDV